MSAKSFLILSVAVLGLAACATAPDGMDVADEPSSPQPRAEHDWFFSSDADAARLAYGAETSDDLRLGLDCARGTGRLDLSRMAKPGSAPEIYVESGGETERYPAQSEPSQLDEGVFLTGEAATTDPVFQRFRRLGWLALWRDGTRETYAAHPGARPDIERFFAFCG